MNTDGDGITDLRTLIRFRCEPQSPLTVIRRTSQVCRSWRQLLLDSPSIWGRLLDLDSLNQETADWRIEVLRRSGQSPLCISGEVTCVIMEDFFLALLNDHWSRIRNISVQIKNERGFGEDVWEPLTRPTSVLESFNLSLSRQTSFPSRFKTKLFGNKAPSLAEFCPKNINFTLQAPWVSQLRCLEISQPSTVHEVIETIKEMAFLDTIILGGGVRPMQTSMDNIPQVFLPGLTKIELNCLLETAVQFLEHVTPNKGCGLSLVSSTFGRSSTQEVERTLEAACLIIAKYADNYFAQYSPRGLRFHITQAFFILQDLPDVQASRSPSSPTLTIMFAISSVQPRLKATLFRVLTPVSSSMMSELDLLVHSIDPSDADMTRVLYSFTSLKILHMRNFDVLSQLQDLTKHKSDLYPTSVNILFPKLQTLNVAELAKPQEISTDVLRAFLSWREIIGVPIDTLDLRHSRFMHVFGDLGFLENFHIRVIWWGFWITGQGFGMTEEYVCPGGDPSRLDFRDQH